MIFLFRTRRWCGLNLLIAATLGVVLLFSGCASQPQSITGETTTSTLRKELQHLENSKSDGQQLADYLRIAQITSQRLEEKQSGPDEATSDSPITTYNRAVADFVVSWSKQNRPQEIHDTKSGRNTHLWLSQSSDSTWSPIYFASAPSQ
jgi:hypothetical protein